MDALLFNQIFARVKPLCDSLKQDPSADKVKDLTALVEKIPKDYIKIFSEAVILPLVSHIKKKTFGNDINLMIVDIIRRVISQLKIDKEAMFIDIYYGVRNLICKQNNGVELIKEHEELKESVVLCIGDLFQNSTTSIIEEFYQKKYAALISHGVYICVLIARLEKSISLRCSALNTLMILMQVHEESDEFDVVLRSQVADVVILFLPGVISGLIEVAVKNDVQNHKITMLSIRAWSKILTLVMDDKISRDENHDTNPTNLLNLKQKNVEDIQKILDGAKRTPEWYAATCEKFKIVFPELDVLTKHPNHKVRKEFVAGLQSLLTNCSRNLRPCYVILLEMLIVLSEDENEQVAKDALHALNLVKKQCDNNVEMKSVVEMLEDNLYELLQKLPRIMRTSGESIQLIWLNRLAGYLKLLGKEKFSRLLLSTAHLKKLLLALVYTAEFDCTNITLLEDISVKSLDDTTYHGMSLTWKQYKFLFDKTCSDKLNDVLMLIGKLGDPIILVDYILKLMDEAPRFKKEFTLILNYIVKAPIEDSIKTSIYKQVYDYYVEPENWYMAIQVSDQVSLQEAQNNIVQICLYLEGLGIITQNLDDASQFLLKTLYLIIERAGSENTLIRIIALYTLERIAKSQNLNSISDLLQSNVDYISYHITVKLRRVNRNPGVLNVIEVVANHSSMDFLPHIRCIVEDVLKQTTDDYSHQDTLAYLKVFYTFIISVKRLTIQGPLNGNKIDQVNEVDSIIKKVRDYQNAKRDFNLLNRENSDEPETISENIEEEVSNEMDTDDVESEVPYFVKMVEEIMKHCLNYLPSQNFNESSMAMAALKEGAFVLRNYQNQLLPLVHQLWHPLVDRFKSTNIIIINHAWQLLYCLADVSRDFIRARTLKQILPSLEKFLSKSCQESGKSNVETVHKYIQVFKLQREILTHLGSVVKLLTLEEKETWNILEITEPYLDCLQMKVLQENCVNLYKELFLYSSDLSYIKCIDIWNRQVEKLTVPNDPKFWHREVQDCCVKSNYRKNLQIIFNFIHEKRLFL